MLLVDTKGIKSSNGLMVSQIGRTTCSIFNVFKQPKKIKKFSK